MEEPFYDNYTYFTMTATDETFAEAYKPPKPSKTF